MNEELELNTEVESNASADNANASAETASAETANASANAETAESAKGADKPWKQKVESIPYDRFKEVNDERKSYRDRATELESRIRAMEEAAAKNKLPEIKSVDDIDPNSFKNDKGELDYLAWLKAREEFVQKETLKKFREDAEKERNAERAQEFERRISNDFNAKMQESAKTNPEIVEAINWFGNTFADKLSPSIRYAMVTDENGPDLIYHLATAGQDIMQQIARGDEIGAIRAMAKWSAKFTRAEANVAEAKNAEAKPAVDEFAERYAKKPAVTASNLPSAKGGTKDPNKMSMEEYREWRKNNK